MPLTRAQLRATVIANTGRTDKDTVINQGLDFGYIKLSQLRLFTELISQNNSVALLAASTSVTLPAGVGSVIAATLKLSNQLYCLEKRSPIWFRDNLPDTANQPTGVPRFFTQIGNVLHYAPKTDIAYTLEITYQIVISGFADDAAQTSITGSDEFLVSYGCYYLYQSLGMYDHAGVWQQKANGDLHTLTTADRRQAVVINAPVERSIQPNFWLDPFVMETP